MTTQAIAELDVARAEKFVGRLFDSGVGTLDVLSVYIGDRLSLYRALADRGALTAQELAESTEIDARYAREWCEQQVATGILELDGGAFALPAEHAAALTDPDSALSIAPIARAIVSAAIVLPQLLEAYRTGGGVPWAGYGADGIESQGDFNRPWLRTALAGEYLPSVPDVDERLRVGARIADVACGVGWAGISIAKAYPNATVVGLDPDESSIALARRFAAEDNVSDRTTFEVHDATEPLPGGPFDLVLVVEAIHDLARPVEVLSRIRESLATNGSVIIADERVGDALTPGDDVERLMYGISLVMCLPASMSEQPSAATGTVMRPDTLRRYAAEARFSKVEVLDQIEHPMLRFYRLFV